MKDKSISAEDAVKNHSNLYEKIDGSRGSTVAKYRFVIGNQGQYEYTSAAKTRH